MTTSKIAPGVNSFLEKHLAPLAKYINPNALTIIGLIFPVITFVLIVNGKYLFAAASMLFFLFDKLDGVFARTGGKVSQWGGFLDATLDRITDSSVYVAIGVSGSGDWLLCSIAMFIGLMVSFSKAKAEAAIGMTKIGANELSVGLMERTERLVLIGVAIFIYSLFPDFNLSQFNIVDIALIVSIGLTFITFMMRMKKAHEILTRKTNG